MLLVVGSSALAVAALVSLGLMLFGLSGDTARDGSRVMTVMIAALPFALGLLVAYGCGVARGGFDWVLPQTEGRLPRASLVLLCVLAAALLALACTALDPEPAEQVPRVLLALRGWLAWTWPVLLVAGAATGLFPALREGLPPPAWQWPLSAAAAVSLLAGVALAWSALQGVAASQQAQVQARVDFDQQRNETIERKVREADVRRDLLSLLPQSSRFEEPHIRELALAKIRSHPDLNAALADVLRGPWPDQAFIFLESNDPPDAPALAPAVLDGIEGAARELQHSIARTHTLHADDHEPMVRRILAVADRYAPYGVDDRPALQRLRDAFDAPRDYAQKTPRMDGQRAIDDWLKRHADGAPKPAKRAA